MRLCLEREPSFFHRALLFETMMMHAVTAVLKCVVYVVYVYVYVVVSDAVKFAEA
jgi:hypothetical protein